MAEIQIEYEKSRCSCERNEVCNACYYQGEVCDDYQCVRLLDDDKRLCSEEKCRHYLGSTTMYLGANTKSYEILSPDYPHEYAVVRIGRRWYYDVTKITLDGKVIYSFYRDDDEEEMYG